MSNKLLSGLALTALLAAAPAFAGEVKAEASVATDATAAQAVDADKAATTTTTETKVHQKKHKTKVTTKTTTDKVGNAVTGTVNGVTGVVGGVAGSTTVETTAKSTKDDGDGAVEVKSETKTTNK